MMVGIQFILIQRNSYLHILVEQPFYLCEFLFSIHIVNSWMITGC